MRGALVGKSGRLVGCRQVVRELETDLPQRVDCTARGIQRSRCYLGRSSTPHMSIAGLTASSLTESTQHNADAWLLRMMCFENPEAFAAQSVS